MPEVAPADIAFILPIYNKFGYARRAALSFLKYTKRSCVIIAVDDASSYYPRQNWDVWREGIPEDRLVFKHFGENKGLTRSWNWGLTKARELGCKYAVCGNSDILFTPHWEHGLIYQVSESLYSLVGPVTNAPGPTNNGKQRIDNYFPGWRNNSHRDYLKTVASYCNDNYPRTQIVEININGFCMFAKTDRWWQGAFDKDHVFDPSKKMQGNEDELQRRWHKKGFRTGFVPSSFVYHYRAVSRGNLFKHHGWNRLTDVNEEV